MTEVRTAMLLQRLVMDSVMCRSPQVVRQLRDMSRAERAEVAEALRVLSEIVRSSQDEMGESIVWSCSHPEQHGTTMA